MHPFFKKLSYKITGQILLFLFQVILPFESIAQNVWNTRKCAVVLTYDDALNVHLDKVIPALDSLGLKGTFYLSAFFPGCKDRLADWKAAAEQGHELGNHTLYHPCIGKALGRNWVTPERDLGNYTSTRFVDEIRMTNVFLQAIDGKVKRTFAYPCGDSVVEGTSIIGRIKNDFVSARGVESKMSSINGIDLFTVGAYSIHGQSGEELIALVKKAMDTNSLLVFLFHGVGGEHDLNVGLKEHRELIKYLKQHEKEIWVAPFIDVTEFVRKTKTR
jgi:peptidoglycan-N-acetylglucosamine deacetylase